MTYRNFSLMVLIVIITAVLSTSLPVSAQDQDSGNAAMVLDVKGTVKSTLDKKPLITMDYIKPGDTITTGKGSQVTFVLFSNNKECTVKEYSKVTVRKDKVVVEKGKVQEKSTKVALALPRNSNVYSRRVMGGVVRTQSLPIKHAFFANPVPKGFMMSSETVFRWHFKYKPDTVTFALKEVPATGSLSDVKPLHEVTLPGNVSRFSFPPRGTKALTPGKEYNVQITGNFKPEKPELTSTDSVTFTVLSPEEEKTLKENRDSAMASYKKNPADLQPLQKLMLVYMTNRFFYDAAEVGKILEKKMPDNINLATELANAYTGMSLNDKASPYILKVDKAQIKDLNK